MSTPASSARRRAVSNSSGVRSSANDVGARAGRPDRHVAGAGGDVEDLLPGRHRDAAQQVRRRHLVDVLGHRGVVARRPRGPVRLLEVGDCSHRCSLIGDVQRRKLAERACENPAVTLRRVLGCSGVTRPSPGCQMRLVALVLGLGWGGRICTSGARPGYGRVRGSRPRRALLSKGHPGPRRPCPGRERALGGAVDFIVSLVRKVSDRTPPRGWRVGARCARECFELFPCIAGISRRSRATRACPRPRTSAAGSGVALRRSAHRRQPVLIAPSAERAPVCQMRDPSGPGEARREAVALTGGRDVSARSNPPRSGDRRRNRAASRRTRGLRPPRR